MNGEWAERNDLEIRPRAIAVIRREHMVGENLAERYVAEVHGTNSRGGRPRYLYRVLHVDPVLCKVSPIYYSGRAIQAPERMKML